MLELICAKSAYQKTASSSAIANTFQLVLANVSIDHVTKPKTINWQKDSKSRITKIRWRNQPVEISSADPKKVRNNLQTASGIQDGQNHEGN